MQYAMHIRKLLLLVINLPVPLQRCPSRVRLDCMWCESMAPKRVENVLDWRWTCGWWPRQIVVDVTLFEMKRCQNELFHLVNRVESSGGTQYMVFSVRNTHQLVVILAMLNNVNVAFYREYYLRMFSISDAIISHYVWHRNLPSAAVVHNKQN